MRIVLRKCLGILAIILIALVGCSREQTPVAQEVLTRCLAAEGGEDRWGKIATLRKTVKKTVAIADNPPIRTVETLEWDIASARWRIESTSAGTTQLTIANATRSTTYRLTDGKIVGATDSKPQSPSLSESVQLARQRAGLKLIKNNSPEAQTTWVLASDTQENCRWSFDVKSSLLSKVIVASSYGEAETNYSDYRRVGGVQFPFRIRTEVKQSSYVVEEEVLSIELDVPLDEAKFQFDDSWRRIKVGEQIPDFEFADSLLEEKTWTRDSVRGSFVLLDFWATWCGPCIAEFPELQEIHQRFAAQGFQILAISIDSDIDQHRSFVEQRLRDWGNARASGEFDSEIAKRFEISSIPRTILIDPDGVILAVDDEARGGRLRELLEKLLSKPQ